MSHKVLQICLSDGWGGLEMYPSKIIPELARQGWQVHGLALAGSRVARSFEQCDVTPLTVASGARALFGVWRLLGYLRRHDIRVVHCHKSSDLRLGALLKTLRPELALFFTDHMGVTRPKKDMFHRWSYGKLTRLFSISEATRERNLRAFPLPAERIQRLYLGVDPARYVFQSSDHERQALRQELGIADGAVAIGLPGRLTPGKGQELWLQALRLLHERYPELSVQGVLIGGTSAAEGASETYVANLREIIDRNGLTSCVTFTGFRADLPRVFGALDIVCVPSKNEAFGLTVIEAMAAGKAVIGSDSGAIPELIDVSCGRLAPPDQVNDWAEAMAELAMAPELTMALGKAGQRRVQEHFTLATHIAQLSRVYAEALEE